MKSSKWVIALVLGVGACSEAAPSEGSAGTMMAPPTGGTAGAAGTASPPMDEEPASGGLGGTGGAGGEVVQAGAGGAGGVGGAGGSMQEPPLEDHCDERRVSYAVPCTNDPNPCGIDSGYPGDEYCLLPPPPEQGFQIHIGPDDYADMAEVGKYLIQAEEEFNNSVLGHIPIEEDVWFDRIQVHMRPGSHHWISSVVEGHIEERVYEGTDCEGATRIGGIGGGQNLIYDNPPGGEPAPENIGLGRPLPGNSSLCMNLHAYNYTTEPQLRELWINIYTVPEAEVTQRAGGIGIVGGLGMSIDPGVNETLTYTETFQEPGRIIQLFGHRHVWTPRFAVWLNDTLIYDSWSWQESVTFNFDSLTTNPPIATDLKQDGAVSGMLEVAAGDELTFSCFIENESEMTLTFSNELYGGEMCNLWGSAVGTSLQATRF